MTTSTSSPSQPDRVLSLFTHTHLYIGRRYYLDLFSFVWHRELLERLKNYMHADGAGLPAGFMDRSSQALSMTMIASLS